MMNARVAAAIMAFAAMVSAQTLTDPQVVTILTNAFVDGTEPTPAQQAALCDTFNPDNDRAQTDITNSLQAAIDDPSSGVTPGTTPYANAQGGIPTIAGDIYDNCAAAVTTTTSSAAATTTSSSSSSSSSEAATTTSSSSASSSEAATTTTSESSSAASSSTATSSSASASASAVVPSFVIGVSGPSAKIKGRQVIGGVTSGYLAADGSIVQSCAQAVSYTVNSAGQLVGPGGGLVSTDGTVANALFVAVNPPLAINTQFSGNPLTWTNSAFAGGAASFCEVSNQIYSVFQTAPVGCITATLGQVPTSSCTDVAPAQNATTINNTIYNGDVYQVNGSIYNNSNNNNVAIVGDGNNVNAGTNNSIVSGGYVSVQSVLPTDIWALFEAGSINYYCSDDYYYYAKFCSSCQVIPVERKAGTTDCYYVDTNGEVICIPGFFATSMTSATAISGYSSAQCGVVVYQDSYCVDKCLAGATTTLTPATTAVCETCAVVPATATAEACETCDVVVATTPATPATTSIIPFTGAATKQAVGSGAFLALFGLLFL